MLDEITDPANLAGTKADESGFTPGSSARPRPVPEQAEGDNGSVPP
jgi:hypothetical protein